MSASHVRRLLPDSRLRRVVVDAETGLPLTTDDTTTEPPGTHQAARACIREWALDEEPTVVDDTPEPRYKASRRLKALVRLRDMRCSGPGCGQPAHVCEFEHRQPYDHANPAAGGQTSAANGHPASVRCHNAKTHGGWTLTRHDDGSTTWTSPLGRGFRRPAFWRPPPAIRDDARLLPPDDPRLLGRVNPRGPTGLSDSSASTDDSSDADTWMVDALTEEDAAAAAHGAAQDAVTHPDGATSPVMDVEPPF